MTELLQEPQKRLPGHPSVSEYDVRSARHVNDIAETTHPHYCVQPRFTSMQYSDAFLDWLSDQYVEDPDFFKKARATYPGAHPSMIAAPGPFAPLAQFRPFLDEMSAGLRAGCSAACPRRHGAPTSLQSSL